MQIGIDARFFGVKRKGLGRYTQKLVENLEKVDSENQYFIFLRAENFDEYVPRNKNFQKVLADFRWYSWKEQLKFPKLLNSYKLDLVHFPHFNVPLFYFRKFVVTVHDLTLIHFPTIKNSTLHPFFYFLKFLAYKIVIKSAIRRSNRIITISKFTKQDILKHYRRIPPEKIIVTYEACEDFCMMSPNKDEEILARYGIMKPYIMYVGNAYPHKNLERLVFAFDELRKKRTDLQLVFVGKEDYFYARLKALVEERRIEGIIFTDYVPDHDLDVLFHNVAAYVFPSLYEGFGLPPLEAMAKGAPVVSSDHPCVREILDESAYFFNAEDIERMAEAIDEVLRNESLRNELIAKGYKQVRKYSWKRMAQETKDVYSSIKI